MIDSLDMDERGRADDRARAAATPPRRCIVVTHGTDTMVETARALAAAGLGGKTIVLTGAMVPYAFGSSDGLFNLGSALSFVQVLPPGRLRRDERPALPLGCACARTGDRRVRERWRRKGAAMTPPPLRSRLPSVGTTSSPSCRSWRRTSGAINLSQGFPDFDCDPALVDAVARHMREGLNQYAPMQGVPALRQAIAAKYARTLRRHLRPRHRGHGHVRRHRGDLRRGRGRRASRRRGHRPRAVLRLVRAVDRAERRRAGRGLAAVAGLPHRLGRGARRRSRRAPGC